MITITKEEALKKLEKAKARKRERVAELKDLLRADHYERTGRKLADDQICVW